MWGDLCCLRNERMKMVMVVGGEMEDGLDVTHVNVRRWARGEKSYGVMNLRMKDSSWEKGSVGDEG